MQISKIHLQNFKRFSDLTIDLTSCPNLPKLVLLIGANGSGKSAVFDAFEMVSQNNEKYNLLKKKSLNYYIKKIDSVCKINIEFQKNKFINSEFTINSGGNIGSNIDLTSTSFYGRSAIRYLPRLTKTSIGNSIDIASNFDKPEYYIDTDNRFENDLDILIKAVIDQTISGVFEPGSQEFEKVKDFLKKINDALPRIFGEESSISLKFIKPVTPADGKPIDLIFEKGNSEISYNLLSSGEKEIINILFNLFARTPYYQDTIYFFDELDAHLHTSLQFNLIKEVVENWIPTNCQIWTATHSLGFIQYAKSINDAAIIDFDSFDFDKEITLIPENNSEIFEIAVPKNILMSMFTDKRKIFCEGNNALLYNSIGILNSIFLGEHNKNSVFSRIEQEPEIEGIIDRDFLSEDEKKELEKKYSNLFILDYYCFENYLYHPDNLAEVYEGFDKILYIKTIEAEKNKETDNILRKLDANRNSYIFFNRNIIINNVESFSKIKLLLESNDFEKYYKVFSMKKRGDLCKIHSLNESKLVKTEWFKSKIKEIIK